MNDIERESEFARMNTLASGFKPKYDVARVYFPGYYKEMSLYA